MIIAVGQWAMKLPLLSSALALFKDSPIWPMSNVGSAALATSPATLAFLYCASAAGDLFLAAQFGGDVLFLLCSSSCMAQAAALSLSSLILSLTMFAHFVGVKGVSMQAMHSRGNATRSSSVSSRPTFRDSCASSIPHHQVQRPPCAAVLAALVPNNLLLVP